MSPAGIGAVAALPDRDERHAILDAVQRFVRVEVAPAVQHPETPASHDAMDQILARLVDLGVLTRDAEPGPGVWDLPAEPLSCRLSTGILEQIAQTSPAIAYAVHLRALAGWLDRSASVAGAATMVCTDRLGATAGRPLGRALAGRVPAAADLTTLDACWGAPTSSSALLVVGPGGWPDLWYPQWRPDGGWQLVRVPATEMRCTEFAHAHGLDELTYCSCHRIDTGRRGFDAQLGSAYVVDTLAVHGMGLLAIAAATARRAVSRARAYSQSRRQGGQVIGAHDAVAELLGRSEQSLTTGRAVLAHLTGMSPGPVRLHRVWQARAQLHPLLSSAGSDALQVLGGVGYMRDVGAEKDLRDLNALRRLGGSPTELTLRCSAFEGEVPS